MESGSHEKTPEDLIEEETERLAHMCDDFYCGPGHRKQHERNAIQSLKRDGVIPEDYVRS